MPRSEGFTLLEILVAFTILSIGLMSLFGSFESGARQLQAAEATGLRLLEARAIIDAALAAPESSAGVQTGRMRDGAQWRLAVEPLTGGAQVGSTQSGRGFHLVLDVMDEGKTVLVLETVGVGS